MFKSLNLLSEVIEYEYPHPYLIGMATKRPRRDGKPPKQRKKKRKMRLSLRQKKIKKTDDYTDSIGWSQSNQGRVLEDAPKSLEPETIMVQCEMCGCRLKIPKPKKHRYTVSCSYPECGHIMKFN
tara:strand:+ start:293 stop:667 length:375 start_codon:yes stop_codon:yes gene_type:complete